MAKFCIHCGRKLNEGEVCTCQANVQNGNIGNDLASIIKGIFVKPVDTIKKYTNEKYFNLSLILILVFGLAGALFVISLLKNVVDLSYGMMYYAYGNNISYLKLFFISLIEMIIFVFGYIGLLYLVNSVIFKGEKNFKKVFSMYAVTSVISTSGLLISAILMFVNVVLGVIVFSLASALNMLYIYKGLKELGVSDENKYGYIYLLTTVFFMIILFVILLIFS